jgi:hypothetical protein
MMKITDTNRTKAIAERTLRDAKKWKAKLLKLGTPIDDPMIETWDALIASSELSIEIANAAINRQDSTNNEPEIEDSLCNLKIQVPEPAQTRDEPC